MIECENGWIRVRLVIIIAEKFRINPIPCLCRVLNSDRREPGSGLLVRKDGRLNVTGGTAGLGIAKRGIYLGLRLEMEQC